MLHLKERKAELCGLLNKIYNYETIVRGRCEDVVKNYLSEKFDECFELSSCYYEDGINPLKISTDEVFNDVVERIYLKNGEIYIDTETTANIKADYIEDRIFSEITMKLLECIEQEEGNEE